VTETLKAFQGLERDFARPEANKELRTAAGNTARGGVVELVRAAEASGVPVARRVATSIRVKSDRLPVISIGGPKKVGAGGAPAGVLVWGSEQGPKGDINHFAVPPNSAGYWIAPAVRAFASSGALAIYKRAVYELQRKYGLV